MGSPHRWLGQCPKLKVRKMPQFETHGLQYVADTSEVLWMEFEATFKSAWKDREKQQSTYKQLIKLSMKGLDIDLYMATFD